MATKSYTRVNWAGYPSKTTPLSADNLNHMDEGIDNVDTKVTNLESRQDNYDASMTDVKGDILDINDSLNNFSFGFTDDGKPGYRTGGASTEIIPFSSLDTLQAIKVNPDTNTEYEFSDDYNNVIVFASIGNKLCPKMALNSVSVTPTFQSITNNDAHSECIFILSDIKKGDTIKFTNCQGATIIGN